KGGTEAATVEAEFFRTARPTSLLRRFAGPEEVAAMVGYVCSPRASATHGAALRGEGGGGRAIVWEKEGGDQRLPSRPQRAGMMTPSLCETCQNVREVRTARSRFLLCELSVTNAAYPKYPPQQVVRCEGYQQPANRRAASAVYSNEQEGPKMPPG